MVGSPTFILGLDLHGTLLEPGEIIRDELIVPVAEKMDRLQGRIRMFICTGNDLEFVKRKVPDSIFRRIDGCVLETGCSTSLDGETEEILTSTEERDTLKALESRLRDEKFHEINYFAHRLTSISMFCDHPRNFHSRIDNFIKPLDCYDKLHITYSSVAVDILPAGYDKHKGLRLVSEGLNTIGVADSMNDRALLAEADYSLAPANIAPELIPELKAEGREIFNIEDVDELRKNSVIVARANETRGVIEILEFLDRVVDG